MAKDKLTEVGQAEKFAQADRELGCDESEEAFAEVVRKVANPDRRGSAAQKPPPRVDKKG